MKTDTDKNKKKKIIVDGYEVNKIVNALIGAMSEEQLAALDQKSKQVIDRITAEVTSGMFATIQEVMSRPEYQDMTYQEGFQKDENGKRLYDQVIEEAERLFKERQEAKNKAAPGQTEPPGTKLQPAEEVKLEILEKILTPKAFISGKSKISESLWSQLTPRTEKEVNGQTFMLWTENLANSNDQQLKIQRTVYCSLAFNAQLPRDQWKLTGYDKRVHNAIANLYEAGNRIVTLNAIYSTMGGKGIPNKRQREKLRAEITKMHGILVEINNEEEVASEINGTAVTPYNYPKEDIRFSMLEVRESTVEYKGGLTQGYLILALPYLYELDKKRNQIYSVNPKVLQVLTLDDTNIQIVDYLTNIIQTAKHRTGSAPITIDFDALCKKLQIANRTKKNNVKDRILECFDEWSTKKDKAGKVISTINYIQGYKPHYEMQKNGVKKLVKIVVTP